MHDNRPDFFNKNMTLLKKNHPHVWELLTQSPPEPVGEICPAPNGRPNIWVHDLQGNRVSLHIPDDPEGEVGQFLAMVAENFKGVVTLTGMGLGYTPLAMIQQRPNLRHLAIFEPVGGIFLQALHALNLTPLLTDPRVILGIGTNLNIDEAMKPAAKALQLEGIQNIKHLPCFSLDPTAHDKVHQKILDHCSAFNIEGNTLSHMGKDFFVNRLRHLNSIHHDRLLADLTGKGKGMPAILVAAGPSLDKNVHLLTEAKSKALIIAGDSALPALAANKVMPDLVGTIDPLELIFEKTASVTPQVHNTSLICMSWASSKMVKFFPAEQIFWCFGAKNVEAWMASLLGSTALTTGAGSVAHLNLLAAIIMECSPIIFVGQDLAFSPTGSHSSHAVLQTSDLSKALYKGNADTIWLDGIEGGKVPSNRGFQKHKQHLETMIRNQKGHYINATEGGARIEGTEAMPLRMALDQFCSTPVAVQKILEPPEKEKRETRRKRLLREFDKITKRGKSVNKVLDKTDQLSRNILQLLEKAEKSSGGRYRSFNELPGPLQKKVAELDRLNAKLDKENSIWPLLQEVTMAGLRQSERQKHTIDSLAKDSSRYMEWLRGNITRFLQINKVRREVLPLLTDILAEDVTFLQAEEKLLAAIETEGETDTEKILELIRLYYKTDNLNHARPWINKLSKLLPESAEINFFLGWVAAHYTEYTKAESFFAKAVTAEPGYAANVDAFRERQGHAYIKYAAHFQHSDKATSRRLLIKGLRYAPEHVGISQQLVTLSDQALREIKKQEENIREINELNDGWLADLATDKRLAAVIGPDRAAQFHRAHGLILVTEENYTEAIKAFHGALRLTPDDPTLHINLTDMYFALEQYQQGIIHLDKAVLLDSAHAVYWEQIGDSLAEAAQHADALAAYEKCFTILPERVHVLKKIGACYMAAGQLEAAKETYLLLKEKMKTIEAETTRVH